MPRHAQFEVRWEDSWAAYRATDEPRALTDDVWGTWVARHRSFAFHGQRGRINLLCERRGSDDGYWYAYRRQGARVTKRYIGRSAQLTLLLLERLAHELSFPASSSTTGREAEAASSPTLPSPAPLPLLATKLQPPRLRTGLVARDRLLQRLDAGMECALTLVVAPAGFGKTTIVNQWMTARGEAGVLPATSWLALDAGDADAARFWRYFIAACQRFHPAVGQEALALLQATTLPPFEPPSMEALLTIVLNDLVRTNCQGVLILEDYHCITAPQVHDALRFFIQHLPAGLHLVVMTRSEPPFPVARWQAQGISSMIAAADLSFIPAETATFLRSASALSLDADDLTQIGEHIEGWAAGLRMLTLALQGHANPDAILVWLGDGQGRQWLFGDYFVAEVLETQPADIQHFLLMTSGLRRLCGALCDAATEQAGSAALLETLERAGLFLEPLEREGNWYRFHALFAEAMQREAQRRLGDAPLAQAAQRASAWYAAQEMLPEAIEAALHGRDFPQAAQLIERYAAPDLFILGMNSIQEFQTLHGWLEAMPEALVRHRPALCLVFAATKLMSSMVVQRPFYETLERIEGLLRDAEDGWRRQGDTARLGEVFAFRALVARQRGALREAITWAEQALAWLPAESSAWRSGAISVRGMGAWYTEDLATARRMLIEAQALSATLGNRAYVRANTRANTNMLTYITLEIGEIHRAEQQFRAVLAEARADDDRDDIGRINGALAQIHYEWNDLAAAWEENAEMLEMSRQIEDEEVQSYGTMMQARLRHAQGETALALRELSAMEERLMPAITPLRARLARELRAQGARLAFAQGDLAAVQRWWEERTPQQEDTPRQIIAQEEALYAQLLLAQGHVTEALGRITTLRDEAQHGRRVPFCLQMQLLLALAHSGQGEHASARHIVRTVLGQALPEGYVRLFIDAGAAVEGCIRELVAELREPSLRLYAQRLLRAFAHERGEAEPPPAETDALSPQELRVLRLLVAGQTNPAIAQELVVSVNTVKAHVKHLYRKLGVTSRVTATQAARQQRIL